MGFSFFTDLITPTKFDVPEAPTVDLDAEQKANVTSNYASFGEAKKLATEFNSFMQDAVAKQLRESMPEFEGLRSQAAKNLAAQLRGELPEDVAGQVARRSNAKALGLGIGGSQAGFALGARDLGLTSLQLQQQAQSALPGYLQSTASLTRSPIFDFSNVFMSPQQRISMQFVNKENTYYQQLLKNQMDAQPAPWAKALAGLGDSIVNAAVGYYMNKAPQQGAPGGGGAGGGEFSGGGISAADAQSLYGY